MTAEQAIDRVNLLPYQAATEAKREDGGCQTAKKEGPSRSKAPNRLYHGRFLHDVPQGDQANTERRASERHECLVDACLGAFRRLGKEIAVCVKSLLFVVWGDCRGSLGAVHAPGCSLRPVMDSSITFHDRGK